MDVEKETKTEINRRFDRLRDRYGSVQVREETVENGADFFEKGKEMAQNG